MKTETLQRAVLIKMNLLPKIDILYEMRGSSTQIADALHLLYQEDSIFAKRFTALLTETAQRLTNEFDSL